MDKQVAEKQLQCYREYIQLLEVVKEVVKESEGKSFTKRITKKIEQKAENIGLDFYVYQGDMAIDRYVSVGIINRNRCVGSYYIVDYQFSMYIYFLEGKYIDSEKTIEGISTRIESQKENIRKFEHTLEHYEEYKGMKEYLKKLIDTQNKEVHHLFEELKIK